MKTSKLKQFTKKLLKELGMTVLCLTIGTSLFTGLLWVLGYFALMFGLSGCNPLFGSLRLGAGAALFALTGLCCTLLFGVVSMAASLVMWIRKLWKDS